MKASDLKLPPEVRARIQVLEITAMLYRGSLRSATPQLISAYADELDLIDERLADLRKGKPSTVLTDKPEAALAGAH